MVTEIEWHQTTNRDNGSLKTGSVRVETGDTVEIRGEGKRRRVVYVMGPPGNWHATFKGQGAVPEGQLEWRLVSRVGTAPEPSPPPSVVSAAPSPTPVTAPVHKPESRLHTLKLVLEILAVAITIIGGSIALVWRSRQ